jgi:NAD(P)-dependent dehydrogenase (short-subunit alcohol dehydrogenase family)
VSDRLAGEVAIITGSTHGIGRATALRFASEGASVVVTGRDERAGEEVLQRIDEVAEVGGTGTFVAADLTDPFVGERVLEAAESLGVPTILVNNAASSDLVRNGVDRALSEMEDENWEFILNVNLTGTVRITRTLLRRMAAVGHGAIINISSRAAVSGVPGIDGYTAVKGALESLTRSIAVEYAEYGVRCNAVQVAFVQVVDEREGRAGIDAKKDDRLNRLLLTRPGRPEDVANAVVFLASAEAEFVTGVVLPVDGGASAVSGFPWLSAKPAFGESSGSADALVWSQPRPRGDCSYVSNGHVSNGHAREEVVTAAQHGRRGER